MIESVTRTAWQRVELARHPARPYSLDYISKLTTNFRELRGDRLIGDDPALIAGLATWHGITVMLFGQQKGHSTTERVARNFGMMHPEGYRKAIRLARTAAKFGFPIISLIDTPGAFPGTSAEERGIASAIANAIIEWFRIRTPVVAAVIGEGGSGGALGMAVADRVVILENAIYSVAAPEVCASILWRDSAHKREAAEQLRLTSDSLLRLGAVDEVIREPPGGAQVDYDETARLLDDALHRHLVPLLFTDRDLLLRRRQERFRRIGYGVGTRVMT